MRIGLPNGSRIIFRPRVARISMRRGEYGYRAYMALGEHRYKVVIKLDGRVLDGCICADADAGYVDYYAKRNGQFILNSFKDSVVIHRSYGKVEILA